MILSQLSISEMLFETHLVQILKISTHHQEELSGSTLSLDEENWHSQEFALYLISLSR